MLEEVEVNDKEKIALRLIITKKGKSNRQKAAIKKKLIARGFHEQEPP